MKEEKKPPEWEVKDPKPPVVRSDILQQQRKNKTNEG